jgi:hypothetical protein
MSAWISPSTSSSGRRWHKISVARRTFSERAFGTEPKFENDSIAMRGCRSKLRARSATWLAISAISSAVGSIASVVSANR